MTDRFTRLGPGDDAYWPAPTGHPLDPRTDDAGDDDYEDETVSDETVRNPIQPLLKDAQGVLRFKANAIVRDLLDFAQDRGFGLNQIAVREYSDDDRRQLAQLMGYSLSGYGELTRYVNDEAYDAAANMVDGIDERDARIAALEQKLARFREAADMLREPIATLLERHPDDFK